MPIYTSEQLAFLLLLSSCLMWAFIYPYVMGGLLQPSRKFVIALFICPVVSALMYIATQ